MSVPPDAWQSVFRLKSTLARCTPQRCDARVHTVRPHLTATLSQPRSGGNAIGKEFVVDVDVSDYDAVRHCCQHKDMCNRCWPLARCAIKTLDCVLREVYGFTRLLWVFSGGRGVHCWVCDKRAFDLTDSQRKSLVDELTMIHRDELVEVGIPMNRVHQIAARVAADYFESGHPIRADGLVSVVVRWGRV